MTATDATIDALKRIVSQVLGEADIRNDDTFVALGGNSLLAMQIAYIMRQKNGIDIDVGSLLSCPLSEVEARPMLDAGRPG